MTDLRSLLDVVHNESLRITRADCGTILLFNTNASSEPLSVSLSIGCQSPETLSSFEKQVLDTGAAKYLTDIKDTEHAPPHEGVRSLMAVPIINHGATVGLIHLHSEHAHHFDDAALNVMQTLALQVSVAISNVQRYQEQFQQSEYEHCNI